MVYLTTDHCLSVYGGCGGARPLICTYHGCSQCDRGGYLRLLKRCHLPGLQGVEVAQILLNMMSSPIFLLPLNVQNTNITLWNQYIYIATHHHGDNKPIDVFTI